RERGRASRLASLFLPPPGFRERPELRIGHVREFLWPSSPRTYALQGKGAWLGNNIDAATTQGVRAMTPTPDSWSDADFQAPSNRVGTVDELVSTILIQLARGGAPIEELRLLILTRLHQGRTQREVEDELVGWRLQAGYAVDLVCSTRTAGNYGVVEVSTELV